MKGPLVFLRLGQMVARRRVAVLIVSAIMVIASFAIGIQAIARLASSGYSDPGSDSAKVWEYVRDTFDSRQPGVVLIVDAGRSVDDPSVAAAATSLERDVANEVGVDKTLSYWSAGGAPQLRSSDGKAGYLFVYLGGSDFERASSVGGKLQDRYDGERDGLRIYASGLAVFSHEINQTIKTDLAHSEAIAIPLTFLLLVLVFGALVASVAPLVIGAAAIAGAFMILWVITQFTDVSVFALNLITGLGLGLGIDYALLVVNRFREELHKGGSVEDAVATTVATAGKTVFFSGLTVAVTLASLIIFPLYFLSSFAYAGVAVVLLAVVGALVPLPALLALLGHRIDKGAIRRKALVPQDHGAWTRVSRFVMRFPTPITIVIVALLAFLAAPVHSAAFSQVDERVLPASSPVATAARVIEERFPGREASPVEIIIPETNAAALDPYLQRLAGVPDVVRVIPPTFVGDLARIQVITDTAPRSPAGEQVVRALRAVPAPPGTLIGGVAADYTDSQQAVADGLPWALLWIVIGVLILLFLFTQSILLPIKAVLLNGASLAATLGVLTWIFIEGHLRWLLGDFTVTGTLDTSTMVLIAVVAFGLSMDYEIFLLSRIKEEHDAGRSNEDAVALGLQRSGRIITAAAMILAVVFAAFLISDVTSIKMMGFGVAFAILLDATIIRALLVPALMRLFGSWNWWAPKGLRRFSVSH
jgi:RND superfamily putative drug exporter